MKSWTTRGTWAALLCCVGLVCCVGMAYADRPDNSVEPVDWDVSPKGLLVVQYDSTGDGAPVTSPCTRSPGPTGTAQPISEIEAQARQDDQWVFIPDYDRDRFVYFAVRAPLFAGNDPLAQVPFLTKEP